LLEKFIAIIKALRYYSNLVVANVSSNNIFLLILYLKVIYINNNKVEEVNSFKLIVILISIIIFIKIVFFNARR